ncbi:hypothetical protein J4468_03040 [Candidatus Woesearchaeota archaeon]|nr:hypothetical protein [Candidatus Woesearchaeota archaeon]
MKRKLFVSLILFVIFILSGCTQYSNLNNQTSSNADVEYILDQNKPVLLGEDKNEPKVYVPEYAFYKFTDPKENAFSIQVPAGWKVSKDSGLIRPYIDAGVYLNVYSEQNQGFMYISPYSVYTVPNDILTFAGFTEGTSYDPSNGLAKPMIIKKYTEASDYLKEYIQGQNGELIETKDRPDLISAASNSLITKQSAAEASYYITQNGIKIKYTLIAYNYLVEISGTGIWSANLFSYYSPEDTFDETERLVLQIKNSFEVNEEWAKKEVVEIQKRSNIISTSQAEVSDTISSTFEYRSSSMDKLNNEWSKTIRGVEEVYNPETDETYTIKSGSKYYWIDNRNNIYGTETYENPFPNEDIKPLQIKE